MIYKKVLPITAFILLAAGCSAKQAAKNNSGSINASSSLVQVSNPPKPDVMASKTPASTFVPVISENGQGSGSKAQGPTSAPSGIPNPPTNCGNNFGCYQTYYQSVTTKFGVAAAFSELKLQYNQNNYVQDQCHPLAHIIGQAAINLYPTLAEAYTHGDSFCWSGYYHGLLEGLVFKIGKDNFPKMIPTICDSLPGKATYSFDYFNCVHGLGHGVMTYTDDQLFDSLKLCDSFSGSWEKSSCYGGVFMENVIADGKDHVTNYLKTDDLLYPCDAVDTPYKEQCYLMQTSYILKQNAGNFLQTFELCQKADSGFVDTCDQSLGRDASSRSNYVASAIKNICSLGSDVEQQSNCVIGAVKDMISYYHSDQQANSFCGSLDQSLQQTCAATAKVYYQSF